MLLEVASHCLVAKLVSTNGGLPVTNALTAEMEMERRKT